MLADAEAERARLDIVIAYLRRELGLSGDDFPAVAMARENGNAGRDAPIVAGRVRSDEFFRLSIGESIMKFLAIMKQPQSPMSIANGLKSGGILTNAKHFYSNVNTELKRLRERDQIVNTPSGWGLSEWYPNKPKAQESKPKKKGRKRGRPPKVGAVRALKDGSMAGPIKSERRNDSPMTYAQFMGEHMRMKRPRTELGVAWKTYKEQHGMM